MRPQLLTIAQVQELLHISRSKVYDLQRSGLLDMRRLGARTMRVTEESVQNLVQHPELIRPIEKAPPLVMRRLPIPEAAEFCGITIGKLAKFRMEGGGPRYIKIGREILYDTNDLEKWLEENKYGSTAETNKRTPS